MKRKLITSILLSLIFIFFAVSTVYSESERNLSEFENCREFFTENNSDGSFIYGNNFYTLYSACVFPSYSSRYVNIDGIIRASSHNGKCAYALWEKSGNYNVTELDSTNGYYKTYSFGKLKSIENSSFAFCDNKAYFVFTDDVYSYVKAYTNKGEFYQRYVFNANVINVFSNDNCAYALLYNGDIYKLNDGKTTFCANINTGYAICSAGNGYIYSESEVLFSLKNGKYEYIPNSQAKCVIKSGNQVIYSTGKTIKYGERSYSSEDKIQALFLFGNKVGMLDINFRLKTINLSDIKNNSNHGSSNKYSNQPFSINSKGYITGIESGTTVKEFKNRFSESVSVYDNKSKEVTSGIMKTGYTASISGKEYKVSVLGDITGEGNVKSNDLSALMSHFISKVKLDGVYLNSADYNNDGKINNKDLVGIARKAKKN